jgi:ABC-2 type transport system permease protein
VHAFTGTWRLVRLALRRDRIKLPIILLVLGFMFYSSAQAAVDFYGKTSIDQVKYAATNAPSVVARVFNGPVGGPDMGAIVLNETYLILAIAIAFVSTMTIVRHTRQNEEFGRSELIESGIVARHASLIAAMIVAVIINLIFAGLVYASLIAFDLPASGALGAAAAMAATGITFAAIAAIAAQLADSGRGANSFSALAIGVAFLLRAVGDGMGTLTQNGLAVKSAFPTWLSPFGWGQLAFPFTEQNWWIFSLYGGFFAAALGTAVVFMARRDIGIGMIPTRLSRAHALKGLLSPFGLARRLQRGTLRGWAIAVVVLGTSFGFVIKDFEDFMAENEEFREAFGASGLGGSSIRDIFLSVMLSMVSIMIAGYAIQSLLRLRSEESGGQAESILGTSVSRSGWQLSHISYVAIGIVVLTVLSGLSLGTSYVASTGGSWSELWTIVTAAFTYSAAIFTLAGFTALLISLFPQLAVAASWASFAGCLLILQLGALLNLPQWAMNISPFGHLPAMPAQDFKLAPVLWLLGVTIMFLAASLLYFNRRDIVTA